MPQSIFTPIRRPNFSQPKWRGLHAKALSKRIGFTRTLSAELVLRDWFLDRPEIDRMIRRARLDKNRLQRMAGNVRTIAKRSIRKRKGKKPSPPGTAPRSRAPGHPMRLISFGFNPYNATVVVGAEYLKRSYSTTVPSVHEHGKRVTVKYPVFKKSRKASTRRQARSYKKLRRRGSISPPKIVGHKQESVNFPSRPFMLPALRKSKNTFPVIWRNSLRRF